MKILLSPDVYLRLSLVESVCKGREFSGYGFVEIEGQDFKVYDVVLLDVGNSGYTEFDSKKILEVLERDDHSAMKLWFHRHPVGNGTPGPHNWSGTDNATCLNEPLGCPDPDKVGWALAIVLTPGGWVGRVDQFKKNKHKTTHVEIGIDMDWSIVDKAKQLLKEQVNAEKTPKYIEPTHQVDYWDIPQEDTADIFDTAHSTIDEAFNVITIAEYQIEGGYFAQARQSIAWVSDIVRRYKHSAYVKHRVVELVKDVRYMMRLYKARKEDIKQRRPSA